MSASDHVPAIAGTVLGAALGAALGGALAVMGWIDTPATVAAIQSHAIVIFAVAISIEDEGVLPGSVLGLAIGLVGLLAYGLALAYGLGIVWVLIKLFGSQGMLAFANDLPRLVRGALEILIGTLVIALWMLFGAIVIRPLFRDDPPEVVAGGLTSFLLGAGLSIAIGLFVFLGGLLLEALVDVPWSVADPGMWAALGGAYGTIQGYLVARAAVS